MGYAGLGAFALVTVACPALFPLGRIDLVTGSVLQLRPFGGMALLAAGTALVFWSLRAIEPGRLTTAGPCVRLRHPTYTGYFLAFAGVVLLPLHLLAMPSLLFVPARAAVARREEADLATRFSGVYRAYAAITGRLWPRRRRGRLDEFKYSRALTVEVVSPGACSGTGSTRTECAGMGTARGKHDN